VFCSRSRVAPQSWCTRVGGGGGMSTETTCYGGRRRFFLSSLLANPHAVPLCLSRAPATVPVWAGLAVTDTACAARSGSLGHVARCCFFGAPLPPWCGLASPACVAVCSLSVSELARTPSTARKQQKNNGGHRWRPAWFAPVHAHLVDTLRAGAAARGGSLVARGFHHHLVWRRGSAHVERGAVLRPPTVGHDRENMAKQLDRETEQELSSTDVLFKACHRELGLDLGRSCTIERNWLGFTVRRLAVAWTD